MQAVEISAQWCSAAPQLKVREAHSHSPVSGEPSLPGAREENQVANDQRSGRVVGKPQHPGEPALPVFCRPAEAHSHPTAASVTSIMPPATLAPLNFAREGEKALDRLQVDKNQTLW